MKIVGYSERGAMNALFYGIAQADDKKAFAEFLKKAFAEFLKIIGIDYHVSDVEFFTSHQNHIILADFPLSSAVFLQDTRFFCRLFMFSFV